MNKVQFPSFHNVPLRSQRRVGIVPLVLTVIVLAVAGIERTLNATIPAEAKAYHARVVAAMGEVSFVSAGWIGRDIDVPPAAVQLLRANAILSRSYREPVSGDSFSLLVVHCSDARDLLGHYPPVCYPNQGWRSVFSERLDVKTGLGGLGKMGTLPITRYVFERGNVLVPERLIVENFMVLAEAGAFPDMVEVDRAARDQSRKLFGAAQVQIIANADASEDERGRIRELALTTAAPMLLATVDASAPQSAEAGE